MKVTGIAIIPPAAAADNPKATPELLAASAAKFSRSMDGIEKILGAVDPKNPEKGIDAIFNFIDYGHASIGGLTGSISMAVEGVSMFLAYKLFEFSQMADGQESSTRYIQMGPEGLPDAELMGIPEALRAEWKALMLEGFEHYESERQRLDKFATEHPQAVRYPEGAGPKVIDRIRKNYALDRARGFIPLATKTNCTLGMTARMWAQTIKQVDSLGTPEAHELAAALRAELTKFSPRLIKHSKADAATLERERQLNERLAKHIATHGVSTEHSPDRVHVSVENNFPDFLQPTGSLTESVEGKTNRYSLAGDHLRRVSARMALSNISIAELRDLNRHRNGTRFTPMTPVGFYLPPEIDRTQHADYLGRHARFLVNLAQAGGIAAVPASMLLGTQVPYEHVQTLDHLVYMIELRTGMGAHFRYAEHMRQVAEALFEKVPEARGFTTLGTAEPE